jgi:TPP-dependent pyruvate/acetoin dehydrogenase alpha subunit
MKISYSKDELINFEDEVAEIFNAGKIKAPVHLYFGNEEQIIEIFKEVNEKDWVFCSWRSHYQALLKGVPREKVLQNILDGKSIAQCFPDHNFYSSAIVGGIVPISVGVAQSLTLKNEKSHVWCFIGDMTSEIGVTNSAIKYALNFDLPITFVIEDNSVSVCTDTRETWGLKKLSWQGSNEKHVRFYSYKSKYPHAGAGVRVQF